VLCHCDAQATARGRLPPISETRRHRRPVPTSAWCVYLQKIFWRIFPSGVKATYRWAQALNLCYSLRPHHRMLQPNAAPHAECSGGGDVERDIG
jgi:hypothetical protein